MILAVNQMQEYEYFLCDSQGDTMRVTLQGESRFSIQQLPVVRPIMRAEVQPLSDEIPANFDDVLMASQVLPAWISSWPRTRECGLSWPYTGPCRYIYGNHALTLPAPNVECIPA
jgi:hypothetical protein